MTSTAETPPQRAAVKIATLSKYTFEALTDSPILANASEMNGRRPMPSVSSFQQSPQSVGSADHPSQSTYSVPAAASEEAASPVESVIFKILDKLGPVERRHLAPIVIVV